MANTTPVARVSALQGQVFAKGKDGELRVLHVGDVIYEADVLVSGDGSWVELATNDGHTLTVRANETLTVDAEVLGSIPPDVTDSALLAAGTDTGKVIKAINEGGSLDALLEETAAGDSGGGTDGGSSFVRLLRIAESVDPLSFGFDETVRGGAGELLVGGGEVVSVSNVNDQPVLLVDSNVAANSVAENAATGTVVGITALGSDADAGTSVTYSLTDNAGGRFTINATTGVVTVANGTLLDAETATSHDIKILATSSDGSSKEGTFTINVSNVNEAPVNTVPSLQNATEDAALAITGLSVNDVDGNLATVQLSVTNGTLSLSLAGGAVISSGANGSGSLTLSGTQAQINAALGTTSYKGNSNFNGDDTLTIVSRDGGGAPLSDTDTVAIKVAPFNDQPVLATNQSVNVSEEGLIGGVADSTGAPSDSTNLATVTGKFIITDPDNSIFSIALTGPTGLTSGGQSVSWSGGSPGNALVGTAGGVEVIRVAMTNTGDYTVTLSRPIDHANAGQENIRSLGIGVSVSDGSAPSVAGTLTVNIEDDSPSAGSSVQRVYVKVDQITVNNLDAGFVNDTYLNNTSTVSRIESGDGDNLVDGLRWGVPASGSGKSGYNLVDNVSYSTTGALIHPGVEFKLGDFTHINYPMNAGSSILSSTNMSVQMNVVINGVSTPVSFNVRMTHTETTNTNDPIASRDIITLADQTAIVTVGGQDYQVNLLGFKDANGVIVDTIRTDENTANNTFGVYASITTIDAALPQISGHVDMLPGADGTLSNVVWGNVASSYGTFVGNADGSYTFKMNQATKDAMHDGDELTQNFTYSVTDRDGDASTGSVTLSLGGYHHVVGTGSAETLTGTAASDILSGYAGNDTLNGGDGNDVLMGGAGTDVLNGGAGADVLRWSLGETGTDTVQSFGTVAGSDILDLRDMLVGEMHIGNNAGNLANYLHFTTTGGTTTLTVNADAVGGVEQTIVFQGTDLSVGGLTTDQLIIQDLLNKGKLITD